MNNSTDIAIVIPIYRDFLDKYEQESINSVIRNFNDFEITKNEVKYIKKK